MGGLSSLDSWNNGAEVALGESAGFFHGDHRGKRAEENKGEGQESEGRRRKIPLERLAK